MRGGEKVVESLCRLFPQADIFTHVYDPRAVSDEIRVHKITTSYVNKMPLAKKMYQRYLPFMPKALERLDLRGYDLVISSESGPAKGVICDPEAVHVCYCHSPMRYLWDQYQDYRENVGRITRAVMDPIFHRLRQWDVTTAARVDAFAANSKYVAQRIKSYWRRNATVINPPVAVENFVPSDKRGDYYLWLGQLVSYKRPDVLIDAFNLNGKRLIVAGEGGMLSHLKKRANRNIEFTGRLSDSETQRLLEGAKALVFPGVEDFGIVPVESQAAGAPVVAYNKGGATETVTDGVTGCLFDEQTPESLNNAIDRFESLESGFDIKALRKNALRFTEKEFHAKMTEFIQSAIREKRA